jgi:drug/metabolite transporter (DMT)-like permease
MFPTYTFAPFNMNTSRTKAHLAVITANLLFGINYSMVKVVTPSHMTSFALNVARLAVSVPLFWILFLFRPSKAMKAGIDKADVPRFIVCSICGVAINQLLFIKGLSMTSTIHGSLLALGTPIFITATAAWLLREKLTLNKALGLLLGVAGAILLIAARTGPSDKASNWLGDVYIIINSISYAFYFVWVRPLMEKYNPVHVIRWIFTIGSFFILPFGIFDFADTPFHSFPAHAWIALLFVTLGATFLSYLLNMIGLKFLGPGITGTYIYTQPLFAAFIGILFLGEHLGLSQILAAVLIIGGVLLVNDKLPFRKKADALPS